MTAAYPMLVVFVPGRPAPQGSKRYLGRVTVEASAKTLKPWRADIRDAALEQWAGRAPLLGAVEVCLTFVMPRPASTPKTRIVHAIKRPDLDKLARAVLDALGSAGVWKDDAQVVDLHPTKRLAAIDEAPGCHILVEPIDRPELPEVPW